MRFEINRGLPTFRIGGFACAAWRVLAGTAAALLLCITIWKEIFGMHRPRRTSTRNNDSIGVKWDVGISAPMFCHHIQLIRGWREIYYFPTRDKVQASNVMNIKFECPGRWLVPNIEMARNHETVPAFIHQQILPSPPVQGIFTGFIQLGKAQLPWLLARTDRITRDASTLRGRDAGDGNSPRISYYASTVMVFRRSTR
jgi:hypothetical protein